METDENSSEGTQSALLELLKQHQQLGAQILGCGDLPAEVADAIGSSGRAAVQHFQQIQRERMMQSARKSRK